MAFFNEDLNSVTLDDNDFGDDDDPETMINVRFMI